MQRQQSRQHLVEQKRTSLVETPEENPRRESTEDFSPESSVSHSNPYSEDIYSDNMSGTGQTPQASTSALPAPQINYINITPEDLQALLHGIVRGTAPNTSKELKFAEQKPFSGKPEDLEPLVREAELRFAMQSTIFNTATKKAYYILSLFQEGNAKNWKEQYIQSREGESLCRGDSFTNFKNNLHEVFKDVESRDDALSSLQRIR